MRNDTERKAFVETDKNWQTLKEIPDVLQLQSLIYKGHEWIRLRIYQVQLRFDYEKCEPYKVTDWSTVRWLKLDKNLGGFSESMSVSQILREIKEIDKEVKDEQ